MIKVQRQLNYCVVPDTFLKDKNLSLEAKGLMTLLHSDRKFFKGELGDILETSKVDKKKLSNIINELIEAGYIEVNNDDYIIKYKDGTKKSADSKVTSEDITTRDENTAVENTKKKLNLYQKCDLAITEFTNDPELQTVLRQYLDIRMNPAPGSRLETKRIPHINMWKSLLNKLGSLSGNKVDIVIQSIQNSWATFVEIHESNKVENNSVTTQRYSEEEKKRLKEKAEQEYLNNGKRRSF